MWEYMIIVYDLQEKHQKINKQNAGKPQNAADRNGGKVDARTKTDAVRLDSEMVKKLIQKVNGKNTEKSPKDKVHQGFFFVLDQRKEKNDQADTGKI